MEHRLGLLGESLITLAVSLGKHGAFYEWAVTLLVIVAMWRGACVIQDALRRWLADMPQK